jgi:hypothetical protein
MRRGVELNRKSAASHMGGAQCAEGWMQQVRRERGSCAFPEIRPRLLARAAHLDEHTLTKYT